MTKSKNSQNSQKSLTLCERLRSARQSMALSRQDLATRLGLTGPSQISRYETGKTLPTIPVLQKYADTLDVDLHWLITGVKSPGVAYAQRQAAKALRTSLPYISGEIDYLLREQARIEKQIAAAEAANPPRSTEHHRRYHTELRSGEPAPVNRTSPPLPHRTPLPPKGRLGRLRPCHGRL